MYKKIYLILLDAYPLNERLLHLSKKQNFELFPQITTSIFTMPTFNALNTGKDVNKNRLNGMFYSMLCSQYYQKYISIFELLSKLEWNIYVDKKAFFDFWNKYLINLDKLNINKDRIISCNFDKKSLENIQNKKENLICWIRKVEFHDIAMFDIKSDSNQFEKALNNDIKFLDNINFQEENSFFCIFADHGYNSHRELIMPDDFITWVLIKDNIKKNFKKQSIYYLRTPKCIYNDILSILDIDDLDYDYKLNETFNKDKIYFVEDSRLFVTPSHSDSSAALIILKWSHSNYPIKFLQLTYFRGEVDKEKRYILCEHIKEEWLNVKRKYNTNIIFAGYELELKHLFNNHNQGNIIRKLYISLWENITSMFKLENSELKLDITEIKKIRNKSNYNIPKVTPEKLAFIPSLNRNFIYNHITINNNKDYWKINGINIGNEYKIAINNCLNKVLTLNINELNESFNYYIHPRLFMERYNSQLIKFIHIYKKNINNNILYNLTDNDCNDIIINDNSWDYVVTCFVGNFKENLRKTNKKLKIDIIPKYTYNQIDGIQLFVFENINNYSCKIFKTIILPDTHSINIWKYKFSFISVNTV